MTQILLDAKAEIDAKEEVIKNIHFVSLYMGHMWPEVYHFSK